MIKTFEKFSLFNYDFNIQRKPKNIHSEIDPYNEEDWDGNTIYCDGCGKIIDKKSTLFMINGKPYHPYTYCVLRSEGQIRNLKPVKYKDALKILNT